jgi:hypothetical protein
MAWRAGQNDRAHLYGCTVRYRGRGVRYMIEYVIYTESRGGPETDVS